MTPAVAVNPPHDDKVPALDVSVIVSFELVTTLLPESSTLITGWVVSAAPDAPDAGWVVNTSWVAAPWVVGEKFALVPDTTGAVVVWAKRL